MAVLNAKQLAERDLSNLKAGYARGLLGTPLAVDDVGLSREQLIEKYCSPGVDPVRTPIE